MNDDTNTLSTEEAAFFDSKGETAPAEPTETVVTEQPAKVEAPIKEEPVADTDDDADPVHKTGDLSKAVVAKNREISDLKRQKRELETREATLNGRMSVLERLARGLPGTEEAQKPVVIDPDADPLGAIKNTYQTVEELKAQLKQRDDREAAQSQEQQFITSYRQAADAYTKDVPDFPAAYTHLVSGRAAELELIGHDPQMVTQIVVAEEKMIINTALAQGKNPLESLYAVAKLRGYAKAAEAAPPQAKTDDVTKILAMKKAEPATRTLSNAPGSARSTISLEDLANMSEDEFAEETSGKNWRKFFGA